MSFENYTVTLSLHLQVSKEVSALFDVILNITVLIYDDVFCSEPEVGLQIEFRNEGLTLVWCWVCGTRFHFL